MGISQMRADKIQRPEEQRSTSMPPHLRYRHRYNSSSIKVMVKTKRIAFAFATLSTLRKGSSSCAILTAGSNCDQSFEPVHLATASTAIIKGGGSLVTTILNVWRRCKTNLLR